MTEKERKALTSLDEALEAIQRAMEACGDARLSFFRIIEPLLGAHQCVADVTTLVRKEAQRQ